MSLPKRKRMFKKTSHTLGALVCAAMCGSTLLMVAQADEQYNDFTRRVYVGAGVGATQLEPKVPNAALSVAENTDAGFHVVAGYDFTSRLSAEVYYADLGAAEIAFLGENVGDINYQVYGLSGIAYLVNSRSGFKSNANGMGTREGLSLYARVGIGGVSADSMLDYKVNHATHLALGLGAEYGFRNGFAVRGEYRALDTDQQYASLSLVKRFGKVSRGVAAAGLATLPVELPDVGTDVKPPEKPTISGVPSVNFAFDQSVISSLAAIKLDELVAAVGDSDETLTLEGHTDWIASERYNYDLSLRRAESVRRYLESKGISRARMTVRGFGEKQPIASNETAEGRASNRRVDIRIN